MGSFNEIYPDRELKEFQDALKKRQMASMRGLETVLINQ